MRCVSLIRLVEAPGVTLRWLLLLPIATLAALHQAEALCAPLGLAGAAANDLRCALAGALLGQAAALAIAALEPRAGRTRPGGWLP